MFWRFVLGALRLRRRRLLLAFSAMAVAGALATALFTVYSEVEKKLREQFQAYGANAIVAPAPGALTVPLKAADEVRKLGGTAVPILYSLNKLSAKPVVLAGMDLVPAGSLTRYWRVDGRRGNCLAGVSLGLKTGDTVNLDRFSCTLDGIVSTGGAEDSQIILPLKTVASLAGSPDAASLIQVRIPMNRLDELSKALPGAEIRPVRAIAETESNVVLKVRLALFVLLAVILVIVTISVSSNFGELVMERSKEIGILKAIGANEARIAGLFVAESLIISIIATVTGYGVGVLLAGWIDQSVFETKFAIHPNPVALVASAVLTLLIAGSATAFATGRIWRIEPATILRGE